MNNRFAQRSLNRRKCAETFRERWRNEHKQHSIILSSSLSLMSSYPPILSLSSLFMLSSFLYYLILSSSSSLSSLWSSHRSCDQGLFDPGLWSRSGAWMSRLWDWGVFTSSGPQKDQGHCGFKMSVMTIKVVSVDLIHHQLPPISSTALVSKSW